MTHAILQINSSARSEGSLSRQVSDYLVEVLQEKYADSELINRDLARSELPLVTEAHIGAYFTPADQRNEAQKQLLTLSDQYIAELKRAKTLVIAAPIYNFSVPAALKAWIDLVCRVGETFRYTDQGPQGLLNIDQAYLVVSAGGTEIGSDIDFNSAYLQQICRFIGIKESHVINVSGSKRDSNTVIKNAGQEIDQLLSRKYAA